MTKEQQRVAATNLAEAIKYLDSPQHAEWARKILREIQKELEQA